MYIVFNQVFQPQAPAALGFPLNKQEELEIANFPSTAYNINHISSFGFNNKSRAEDFASWLAKRFSGQEFHVLKRTGSVVTNPPTVWNNLETE